MSETAEIQSKKLNEDDDHLCITMPPSGGVISLDCVEGQVNIEQNNPLSSIKSLFLNPWGQVGEKVLLLGSVTCDTEPCCDFFFVYIYFFFFAPFIFMIPHIVCFCIRLLYVVCLMLIFVHFEFTFISAALSLDH